MDKVVNLAKRRGLVFSGSEIYGGLANSYDFGPLGVELKNNIKKLWWRMFVQERSDVVGLDSGIILSAKVWERSGHLKNFNDELVECKSCHERYKAGDLKKKVCPSCGKDEFTKTRAFNTMFKTNLGPVATPTQSPPYQGGEEEGVVYLRPETAQGIFVDFKTVQETSRQRVPFGIAQIGKVFRNEITPGNFIFRTREFEQMEIEYFVREENWKKHFDEWESEMKRWIEAVGIDKKRVKYVDVPDSERAHYSKKTIDIEFEFPFGQSELYGLAYRTDFDLKAHGLDYRDPATGDRFVPHVIEPSLGVERTVLAVLLSCYDEVAGGRTTTTAAAKEKEIVLRLPRSIAPIKAAVLPLSKKKELTEAARAIRDKLAKRFMTDYDETGSIGRRYRRQDEVGTPFCITVDFDTLNDNQVTIRERDTMEQKRLGIEEVEDYLLANL